MKNLQLPTKQRIRLKYTILPFFVLFCFVCVKKNYGNNSRSCSTSFLSTQSHMTKGKGGNEEKKGDITFSPHFCFFSRSTVLTHHNLRKEIVWRIFVRVVTSMWRANVTLPWREEMTILCTSVTFIFVSILSIWIFC